MSAITAANPTGLQPEPGMPEDPDARHTVLAALHGLLDVSEGASYGYPAFKVGRQCSSACTRSGRKSCAIACKGPGVRWLRQNWSGSIGRRSPTDRAGRQEASGRRPGRLR